jgi:hypothetical protein
MDHFETQNLIFFYLVCLTSLKSNVIFLILFEIFFFLTFHVDLGFVTLFLLGLFHDFFISSCMFSEFKFQKGWVCYYFYIFLFLAESNRPITHLYHKS